MSLPNIFHRKGPEKDPSTDGILLSPKAIRQLDRLQLNAGKFLHGEAVGGRSSFRRKPAPDFREHRTYVPGDDVRYVDWRASARHEQIFIKQGEETKEATVFLLLDCSASMDWGEPSKKRAQLQMAAALSYLTLSNRDRLMIYPYGKNKYQPIGPINGKGQMPWIIRYMENLEYGGSGDLLRAVRNFNRRVTWGGLLFILSDMMDKSDLGAVLELLPAPTWQVNVFHFLHPLELNPDLQGGMEMVDVETGERMNYEITSEDRRKYQKRLKAWQRKLDMDCVEAQAFYTTLSTEMMLEREMISHLREVKVVSAQ